MTILAVRIFSWSMVGTTAVFILDNYLTHWMEWPGATALFVGDSDHLALAAIQALAYVLAIAVAVSFVITRPRRGLRRDAAVMTGVVTFIVRFAFFAVLLIGLADFVVSFLRVEGLLEDLVGEETAGAWGFNENRAPAVHLPALGLALLLAIFTRTLGFHWLAVLVVLAELTIVLSRFVFSYEQAFQGDLVRFWYGALFLFASAYTLYEDGHVRVDVFYANMSPRAQGWSNAIGSVLMGILFCWVILFLGLSGKSSIITAPILSLEITQAGFGMYVKYLMAAFLAVFGVTMMVQFCAYLLESTADLRGEPGGRAHHVHGDSVTEV